MAINKQRLVLQDTKPDRPTRRATTTEEESVVSFGQPVEGKPTVRYAWQAGNDKVGAAFTPLSPARTAVVAGSFTSLCVTAQAGEP